MGHSFDGRIDPVSDLRIRPEVAARLGFYVYLYIDPRTGKPFYVGKGQGSRALAHLSASTRGSDERSARLAQHSDRASSAVRTRVLLRCGTERCPCPGVADSNQSSL